MAYETRVSDDGAHIILKVTGTAGRTGLSQVVEAHALGAKLGIRRYIDLNARVAALVSPGDHSHDFL